jgi:BirA family biotin operon repressor/biotin-[acetyl-CoA-carboxylase] ligase
LLALLRQRQGEQVSGEELSRHLGISRTAVWKQVNKLKESGYVIDAVQSRGYRLCSAPDLFDPATIMSGLQGCRRLTSVISLRETVSTNMTAYRMAEEGAGEGTVVLAETQTGGKGRMGRSWASPPGVNLYCSIILRPSIPPVAAAQLTFLSAVGVARAIERTTSLNPRIKWPNDILLGDRKVAGLLNEMSSETDRVNFVILGIGVNLNMAREQFPVDLRTPATSLLLETGTAVGRSSFATVMLREIDDLYDQFLSSGYGPVRAEWLTRSRLAGEMVGVSDGGRERQGRVVGLDEYGALLLETADGQREQVLSGDVRIL